MIAEQEKPNSIRRFPDLNGQKPETRLKKEEDTYTFSPGKYEVEFLGGAPLYIDITKEVKINLFKVRGIRIKE